MKNFIIENLDFNNLDERLQHLNKDTITEMIYRYYRGDLVSKIIEDYEINIASVKLFSIFPREISNETCIYCDQSLVKNWNPRIFHITKIFTALTVHIKKVIIVDAIIALKCNTGR